MRMSYYLLLANNAFLVAAANWGQSGATWLLGQLKWLAFAFVGISRAVSILKKNTVGVVVTLLLGALVIYFIGNPSKLEAIGNSLGQIFGF